MKNKYYLDNVLKSIIDDNLSNIEISRDVFTESWNRKESGMSKKRYSNIKNTKKTVLVSVCCVALAISGIFTFFPGARVAAQDALKTIFVRDKSGNVVEKPEDTEVWFGVGDKVLTEKNKVDMERKLGFKVNLPGEIGKYTYKSDDSFALAPRVEVCARVKYKDEDKIKDKLKKALDDDKVFEELKKDYELESEASSSYVDDQGHKFRITLSKDVEAPQKNVQDNIKEVNIDNTECIILQDKKFNYGLKMYDDGSVGNDIEHKPISSEEQYIMFWTYNGVNYYLDIGKNSSDIDAAIEFATDYIRILQQ